MDTAPVKESIADLSSARRATLPAVTPRPALSPSTKACTSVLMRFSDAAPAPLSAAPTMPPDSATAPANTVASMVWSDTASSVRLPPTTRFESRT